MITTFLNNYINILNFVTILSLGFCPNKKMNYFANLHFRYKVPDLSMMLIN